jgi:hypothetical protein
MARVAGKSYLLFVSRRVAPFSRLLEQSQHRKSRQHRHNVGSDSLHSSSTAMAFDD